MAENERVDLKRSHDSQQNEVKSWKQMKLEKHAQIKQWKEARKQKKLKKLLERQGASAEVASEEIPEEDNPNGRAYSVSIAVPGSILGNAQSPQLRTYLSGQIARAAAVFNVDEIVVFDELGVTGESKLTDENVELIKRCPNCQRLVKILQYLECPQYLRKCYFPIHDDLEYAGLLNPLEIPHHLRVEEKSKYREGIVLNKPVKNGKGSYVYIGLNKTAIIDKELSPNIRVTVKLDEEQPLKKHLKGTAVSPSVPCKKDGIYWGYSVRLANSLGAVFSECPYKAGYDLTIGTSDQGDSVDSLVIPDFKHMLIVFGGLKGIEYALESDEALDINDPRLIFHHYINACPSQGSRTIRTEEAILITLSTLRSHIVSVQSK